MITEELKLHFLEEPMQFESKIQSAAQIFKQDLERWGMIIDERGLVAYPSIFKPRLDNDKLRLKTIILDHLQSLQEGFGSYQMPQGFRHLINSIACRSAIKFGDALNMKECQELVLKLSGCDFPFQCIYTEIIQRCSWSAFNDSFSQL